MLHYIKKYPFSLLVIFAVLYLSFFKPPQVDEDLPLFPGLDKLVHLCMYLGMSGVLWWEFYRAHRYERPPMHHAWIGAFVCPILLSGLIELLQAYATEHRGGEWLDFVANVAGVLLASFVVRSWIKNFFYK